MTTTPTHHRPTADDPRRPGARGRRLGRAAAVSAVALGLCLPAGAALALPSPVTPLPAGVTRTGGETRIETALALSQRLFTTDGSAGAAVIATSNIYADSIGGARLASAAGAPLLLTGRSALVPAVGREVERLVPPGGTVYVLGGEQALSAGVEASLAALDGHYRVVRLQGETRYETAVAIADATTGLTGDVGPVYLATGANFPDGLAVAPLAAHTGGAIVLTQGASVPPATAAYLAEHDPQGSRVVPVGGPAAVAQPSGGRAIAGADRYETAAKVAARFSADDGGAPVSAVGLATGANWPDALVGAGAMGQLGGPLLLHSGDRLSDLDAASVQGLEQREPALRSGLVVGGPDAVPQAAADDLAALLR